MIYRWNPGWIDALFGVFCVVCPAIILVVRSKWKRSEIRRQEVRRLARMAAAEAEMAEKEAAEFIYAVQKQVTVVDGGVIGTINCAVCLKPTTTRCSRCKAVRYCSGSCQIIHWRDGHKYECHPPVSDDHYKGPSHISDINRGLDKRSEISRDGSIEGKSQATNYGFCVDQSVSNMVEEQSEHSVLVGSRLDIEGKTDNIKPLETTSTIPVSSEFKASSRIHSENGGDLEEHFVCISEKGSTIDSLPSGYSTICGSVEMIHSASSDEDLTKTPPGQHPYEDALNNLDEFFSSSDKLETSVINVNQANLPIIPPGKIVVDSLGLKPNMKRVIDETKLKSSAPSKMSTPKHDKLTDSGINKNAGEFISMGLCSRKFDKSESLTFSDSYCENQGDTPDLDASTTISCAAESQSCHSIQHLERVSDKPPKVNNGFVPYGKALKEAVQLSAPLSSSLSKHNQLELHNCGPGNFNYKALFPYDYFIKLYNSDKVAISPSGLVNCGNSCYANAVLQCLAFTRPLAAFVLDGFHSKTCPKKSWCFLCEFEALLIKVKQGKSPVSPSGIMAHIGGNFRHGMEEDAHEFLRYSIDALQSACLKEVDATAACELAEETTLIQLIFGGYLRSKIKCLSCQGKSERRERMMDLTIDVYGDIGTLEDALARFTASEILVGENKYKCDRCNSFQQAKKQLTVLEAPNVLTIALKRYQNGKYGKLDRMVRFSEYLNLAPYMRGSDDNSPVYRLYAVVVHNGHSNATFSGHYVCYVKNSQGKWFKTDDSAVKSVELEQVLSQRAYLLLYTRCSPRAPSSLRNEMAKTSRKAKKEQRANSAGAGFSKAAESWSDISSIFSFSDEGSSWSTASTKDSAVSDDLPDCYGPSASSSISEDSLPPLSSSSSYSISSSSSSSRNAWINTYFLPPKPNVLLRRPGGTNANGDDRTARSFY